MNQGEDQMRRAPSYESHAVEAGGGGREHVTVHSRMQRAEPGFLRPAKGKGNSGKGKY